MHITRADLKAAVAQTGLPEGTDAQLWSVLESGAAKGSHFGGVMVAYYAGALIVMGAMGWFMTNAWDALAGLTLTGVAALYAALFVLAGRFLWDRLGLRVPGGLLFTLAVTMAPLALFGVLKEFGWWPQGEPGRYRDLHFWIKGSWITLELGTIAAGCLALRFRRFAFITAPIAVALWYLSMDLGPLLLGSQNHADRQWISVWFGLVILVAAYATDRRRTDEDFAFWLYLFGATAFWGGLSLMNSHSELGKFLYAVINVVLLLASCLLRRVIFLVFGALGLTGYIGHLSYRIFHDSLLFPVALTTIGLSLITLAVIYQRNRRQIDDAIRAAVPAGVRSLLPPS